MIDISELKGTEEINPEILTQQTTGGATDNLKIKQVQFQSEKAFNLKVRLTRTIKITSTDTAKGKKADNTIYLGKSSTKFGGLKNSTLRNNGDGTSINFDIKMETRVTEMKKKCNSEFY